MYIESNSGRLILNIALSYQTHLLKNSEFLDKDRYTIICSVPGNDHLPLSTNPVLPLEIFTYMKRSEVSLLADFHIHQGFLFQV